MTGSCCATILNACNSNAFCVCDQLRIQFSKTLAPSNLLTSFFAFLVPAAFQLGNDVPLLKETDCTKENYPDSELTLNSRIGPTTMISSSVYPNQETIEKTQIGRGVDGDMIGRADKSQGRFTTRRLIRCSIFVSVQVFCSLLCLRTTKLYQG